jgi:Leucine-rich repeat (LRR) protein
MSQLMKLRELGIERNQISSLPEGFSRMRELQTLEMNHNLVNPLPSRPIPVLALFLFSPPPPPPSLFFVL